MIRRVLIAAVLLGLVGCGAALVSAHGDARLVAPPPTKLVLDRHGRFLGELDDGADPIGYWPVTPVPPRVGAALVGIEDQRFWDHGGLDVLAVLRALRSNLTEGRHVSGASTIAMQVARMQKPGARTYPKKLMEALTAIFLVHRYGHEAVLAQYLRIAPYGNRVRGIDFAARRYFDKPVADLSYAEIAFLSAIPQSPSRMNPYDRRGRQRAIRRGERILAALHERQVIADVDLALAREQIARIDVPERPTRPAATLHVLHTFDTELQAAGPLVRSSIDLELTETLQSTLDDAVFGLRHRGVENGAVVVVERGSNEIVAYVGSANYFDEERSGAIDFASTRRPSGSTLKPFVYGEALDRGVITPATVLDDLFRARGGIENADDRFLGPLLPRVALANSRNVPAANLVHEIGLGRTYDLMQALALHDRERPADHYGIGLALGLLPVRLVDLVAAYGALANDGVYVPPSVVAGAAKRRSRRVLSAASARRVTGFLSDPLARLPTFRRMGPAEYPFGVALKTGTSQGYRDAWTVLFTRRYVVGIWLGRPDAKPMRHVGGVTASAVARAFLGELHADEMAGLRDLAFAAPEGFEAVPVCALSGARATDHCEQSFVEHFAPGESPAHECPVHVAKMVGRRLRTFVDLPPRYAAWAARQDFDELPNRPRIDIAAPPRPKILRPENGARVMRDPEVPDSAATLALVAEVDPSIDQLVWYVDGVPFAVVEHPYAARWPLAPGEHVIEARARGLRSQPVSVIVDP